jgi:hypothetical protein
MEAKLSQGSVVLFKRNGKGMARVGKVLSSCRANAKKVKVQIPGMESNTTLPTTEPLFELKVLVSKEVLDSLELESQEDLEDEDLAA